ncbi:remorin 4.1-like isoform X1 [Olea europaea var. sylvestris]|uniref:remorin 4.1-like isoform X1 n=1 Tax=Olea europaea var. sylvestris TaxID=158386 RepID=UPI000C1CEC19|nr:remorin 4.1-like isoform X1 [Olea europaea var. sylvestris]
MLNAQRAIASNAQPDEDEHIRDIHALSPPRPPSATRAGRRGREPWETSSHRSSSLSMASNDGTSSENFTSISREFNALVLAGSTIANDGTENGENSHSLNNLLRIGEEEMAEETNPLAIVPDNNPFQPISPPRHGGDGVAASSAVTEVVSVQRVKKEEVDAKINAWQNAKIAKINNRFKREDAVISGLESEQVQKATSWMKKVERKLEEKRAKALEKMQNDIAKARKKAEEKKASAEARRGTKLARVLEVANLMRAIGRPPVKRSFF